MAVNRLKQFRELAGLSRRELARRSGVSHETIRRIEDVEGYEPTMRVAKNLAGYFQTDLYRVFPTAESERVLA